MPSKIISGAHGYARVLLAGCLFFLFCCMLPRFPTTNRLPYFLDDRIAPPPEVFEDEQATSPDRKTQIYSLSIKPRNVDHGSSRSIHARLPGCRCRACHGGRFRAVPEHDERSPRRRKHDCGQAEGAGDRRHSIQRAVPHQGAALQGPRGTRCCGWQWCLCTRLSSVWLLRVVRVPWYLSRVEVYRNSWDALMSRVVRTRSVLFTRHEESGGVCVGSLCLRMLRPAAGISWPGGEGVKADSIHDHAVCLACGFAFGRSVCNLTASRSCCRGWVASRPTFSSFDATILRAVFF